MDHGQDLPSGASSPGLDDRYELADRVGHSLGAIPFATLQNMIRQGRLFRTDQISKNGRPPGALADLPECAIVFDEVMPRAFNVKGDPLRPAPEFTGEADAISLGRLFVRIYRETRTGRLFVCSHERAHEKVVIFRQGVPVNAMSNIEEEWLGEVLRNQGLIDQDTFDEVLVQGPRNGKRIGSLLVERNKLSARELHRALAVQAMERLLNVFRQENATFHFVDDETAASEDILLLAGPRDVLETCMANAMGPKAVRAHLADLGDPVLVVDEGIDRSDLNDGDRTALALLTKGQPLSRCVPRMAEALRLTEDEARARILFLLTFGVLCTNNPAIGKMHKRLQLMQSMDYFSALEVNLTAPPDKIEAAYNKKVLDLGLLRQNSGAGAQIEAQIRKYLDKARTTLLDPDERDLYERAVHRRLDFEQPEVRQRLMFDQLVTKGKRQLKMRGFSKAAGFFAQAAELMPDDPSVHVHQGWAQFLASDQGLDAAQGAIRQVERGLALSNQLDLGYLTIGKIARLAGDEKRAEENLRRAISLNPNNHEAQSELRLLFSRELGLTKKSGGVKISLGMAGWALGIALLVSVTLFVGANMIKGGPTLWPDVENRRLTGVTRGLDKGMKSTAEMVTLRLNFDAEKLILAATTLGAKPDETVDKASALTYLAQYEYADVLTTIHDLREIPIEKQVLGSVEYYFVLDDAFWWMRRILLLLVGLFGLWFFNRREGFANFSIIGTDPKLLAIAIPYGIVVGVLGPVPPSSTSSGGIFAMTLFHVLAEQIFFIWFLGRTLLKEVSEEAVAVVILALTFGLYHVSYFAVMQSARPVMVIDLLQISAFAGAAYALLLWRSKGVLAPMLAHLALNGTMAARIVLNQN